MSQDSVLSTIATFGPCTSAELLRCLKPAQQCINDSLRRLKRNDEIRFIPHYQDAKYGLWVAV